MADDYTILNPGAGGDVMDETLVVYPSAPINRKRPRVVITGEGIDDIVPAQTTNPLGDEFGLVTRPIVSSYPGTEANIYDDVTLVPTSVETTIVSYNVPLGFTFYFIGLNASGNGNALFRLYVNSSILLTARSSVANLTVSNSFTYSPIKVAAGDTISIKVIHEVSSSCDFEGTILGYII